MADSDRLIKCKVCGTYYSQNCFFKYKDKSKGHYPVCKDCLNNNVDPNQYSTFALLLKELDYPLVIRKWQELLEHYPGQPILGKYLAKMNLFSWKVYRWEDSKELNESMRVTSYTAMYHPMYMKRDSDYLVVNFDTNHTDIEQATKIHNWLSQLFPHNKVISLPANYNLRTMSKEELRQIKQQIESILGDEDNE